MRESGRERKNRRKSIIGKEIRKKKERSGKRRIQGNKRKDSNRKREGRRGEKMELIMRRKKIKVDGRKSLSGFTLRLHYRLNLVHGSKVIYVVSVN